MKTWSPEQNDIFRWFAEGKGNLVIRARAGTGKTTTIIEGISRAPERRILLAAFNKIIADELQSRLTNPRAEAKTLHGLGFSYLRRAWPKLNVDNRRKWSLAKAVVPKNAPQSVLRCVAELCTKIREIKPHLVYWDTDKGRAYADDGAWDTVTQMAFDYGHLLPSEDFDEDRGWTDGAVAQWALDAAEIAADRTDTIDFSDMIFLPLVHGMVFGRYDLVCVDEAQDMSAAQLELATKATRPEGRVCVIGDDRQCLYSWRGADASALDRMKGSLQAVELGLKTTYRCPQAVVAEAVKLVLDFVAAATAPVGIVRHALDVRDTLVREAGPGDFVLSRTNAPLVPAALTLLKNGKAARIRGRDLSQGLRKQVESVERSGVRNIDGLLAELDRQLDAEIRVINKRVERGEIDPSTGETAIEIAGDNRAVITALVEGIYSFAELYARFDTLFTGDDVSSVIMLSTVHRAKGLEAGRVWLLSATFCKSRGETTTWREGTEEENIRYVAITRAKHELVWLDGDVK